MLGCNELGHLYNLQLGVSQDYNLAHALYEEACNSDFFSGCYHLGNLYNNGKGVSQDYDRARSLFKKACDSDESGEASLGCLNLGLIYYHGNGVSVDLIKARDLYQKDCNAGGFVGCNNLAHMNYYGRAGACLLYTSPSPRDQRGSRMPSSA